jgi:hypothetical protein
MGTSATTATATFGRAYLSAPNCIASWLSGTPTSYSVVTTSIAFTQSSSSGNKISYICTGFN